MENILITILSTLALMAGFGSCLVSVVFFFKLSNKVAQATLDLQAKIQDTQDIMKRELKDSIAEDVMSLIQTKMQRSRENAPERVPNDWSMFI